MTLTETSGDVTNIDTDAIRERIAEVAGPVRDVGSRFVVPTLAMSAAMLTTMVIASSIETGSPWTGVNAVTAGLGLTGRRAPRRFDAKITLVGVGTVIAGALVIAGVQAVASPRIGRSRVARGAIASALGVALDAFVMRNKIFPSFANALGVGGTLVKYAGLGIGAAVAQR